MEDVGLLGIHTCFGLAPICCRILREPGHMTSRKILPHATTHAGCRPTVAAGVQVSPAFSGAPPPGSAVSASFLNLTSCRTALHPRLNPAQPCSSTTSRPLARPLPGILNTFALYSITSISQHIIFILFFSRPRSCNRTIHAQRVTPSEDPGAPSASGDRLFCTLDSIAPAPPAAAHSNSAFPRKQETKRPR